MKTSSMLSPFLPSQRQTSCVLLATRPPPCDRLTSPHALRHFERAVPSWGGVVVPPEVTPVRFPAIAKNLGVMRYQHKLVLVVEQFSHRKHPRLKFRQTNKVVRLVEHYRPYGARFQGRPHHVKSDQRPLSVGKLAKE